MNTAGPNSEELNKIKAAIQAQEALRGILPDEQIEATLVALKGRYHALLGDAGNVDQGTPSPAAGAGRTSVTAGDIAAETTNIAGGNITLVRVEAGGQFFYGATPPAAAKTKDPHALRRYLEYLIACNQHLRLQGIRSGSQPLSVALEKVYISLTAEEKHLGSLSAERDETSSTWTRGGPLSTAQALQRYRRLVIVGDPGCGKTTLLAYLALTYARALLDGRDWVKERLGLDEAGYLPVLLPLRDLGRHLTETLPQQGKDGPAVLLDFLHTYHKNQEINLPEDFFRGPLEAGQAVILLDGMDEMADVTLRQRMAHLIEKFAVRYPDARFVVTSREAGYTGAARIGEKFGLARVRELTTAEVRRFLLDWTRVVETTLAGSDASEVLALADRQARGLISAIETNPRVAELAVNPLLLTVIALVHRYRARLPERRVDLYDEAVEVLLGHWDRAKGLEAALALGGRQLDSGDQRSLLEPVAFFLHKNKLRQLELADLQTLLLPRFQALAGADDQHSAGLLQDFLGQVQERSGLLVERGLGIYGFAHQTFQEYLAARALADRADALYYTLKVLGDPWWREVILLQAGHLSNQGRRQVSALLRAIAQADEREDLEPLHHLLLAVECLQDIGPARLETDVLLSLKSRLIDWADRSFEKGNRRSMLCQILARNALLRLESGQVVPKLWKLPWGEPDWVEIPAEPFIMGNEKGNEDEKPLHTISLPTFWMARVPVTNAQYALFVADASYQAPEHWRGGKPPRGLENHPVVNVSWQDSIAYCHWLTEKIGRPITLPSEAEWEKAARGCSAERLYPWGGWGDPFFNTRGVWADLHANTSGLGLDDTTPVGLFPSGASPYGCLDMSGNVWEWTRSLYKKYPYDPSDGREDLSQDGARVARGGAFDSVTWGARCTRRVWSHLGSFDRVIGFRVCISSLQEKPDESSEKQV